MDLLYRAFDIAEEYRNPVLILADGMMGQMMEPVELPEPKGITPEDKLNETRPWAITGTDNHPGRNVVFSLRMQPDELEAHVEKLFEKYRRAEQELVKWQEYDLEDAEVVFVAFGTVSRLCLEAMELLGEQGIKAGLIRPISLWPYPYQAFDRLGSKTKLVVSAELSMGQMLEDVKLGVRGRWPVALVHRTGGIVPGSREIAEKAKQLLEGLK